MTTKDASTQPPNIRLAKAFNFTAEDLAVNRGGYLSRRQQGWVDWGSREVVSWFDRLLSRDRPAKSSIRRVQSLCGRIRVALEMIDRHGRLGRPWEFRPKFTLMVDDEDVEFLLTEDQYHLLENMQGVPFRLYYLPGDSRWILALERPERGCDQ